MNRGLARRAIFESEADKRFFLSRLARAVRRREIEIHGYGLLTNHYHLLVRSADGKLSYVIQHVQAAHVRRFNRRLGRDGPLFRDRFRSKLVTTLRYRIAVMGYIDRNAVSAGMATDPAEYPYGSAYHLLGGTAPPWLSREWVESLVGAEADGSAAFRERYRQQFASGSAEAQARLVKARTRSANTGCDDALDDLLVASPPQLRDWMRTLALVADRTKPGLPVVDARTILTRVAEASAACPSWLVASDGETPRDAWGGVRCALLRDLGGLTYTQIAMWLKSSATQVRTHYLRHARCMRGNAEYAEVVGQLAHDCLRACHGVPWAAPL
jgi:REP element-mobilizing transposase RayT